MYETGIHGQRKNRRNGSAGNYRLRPSAKPRSGADQKERQSKKAGRDIPGQAETAVFGFCLILKSACFRDVTKTKKRNERHSPKNQKTVNAAPPVFIKTSHAGNEKTARLHNHT